MVKVLKVGESKVTSKYLVVLPKAVRIALNLKRGDYLEWYIEGEKVIVRKRLCNNQRKARASRYGC